MEILRVQRYELFSILNKLFEKYLKKNTIFALSKNGNLVVFI